MALNTITYSSELMKNYVHAEIMSPHAKFEALQTATGLSLLFSVGTDNIFYVTQENHGSSSTGWGKTDLSTNLIERVFSGKSGVSCKTFDVAQNNTDGTIGLAMVINDSQNDHLYLCLGNSNTDTAWLENPAWASFPFDNEGNAPSAMNIVNVFISETTSGQYIVADIVKDPTSAEKLVSRYYIDPKKAGGQAWHIHNITIDLEIDSYSSCLGRQAGQSIDGLYTVGKVGTDAQFIYQPLYNIWNPSQPANPVRLNLPGNIIPQAMASCRNNDQSTDLYVTSNGGLYYFQSSNQKDQAQGVLLFQNSLLTGVTHLYAYHTGTKIVVWGLNQADQVFYTACSAGQVTSANAWSCPLPILSGVDLISPYVNCVNGGNTFFGVGDDTLYRMVQSPDTMLWTSQSITLPPLSNKTPAQCFSSYTTRIHVTDENNQAVANTPLMLSTNSRGNFYINNLSYILDTKPIPVNTDITGNICIIECINDLQGTQLLVSEAGGNTVQINPMDTPFNKVAKLNTVESLQKAVITNSDGSTKPLVSSNVSESDLKAVAQSNQNLNSIYSKLSAPATNTSAKMLFAAQPSLSAPQNLPEAIAVEVGDLFKWLESGVESLIKVVEDEATGLWHFIVTIENKIYQGVLDCVEKVVGAVRWLFNAIKTAFEDLIKFLEFLFSWDDIRRTHEVLKNIFRQHMARCVNNLESYPEQLKEVFSEAIKYIDSWAGIPDNIPDSLKTSSMKSSMSSSNNTPGLNSPPSNLVLYHLDGNSGNGVTTASPNTGVLGELEALFKPLLDALETEKEIFQTAFDSFKADIIDKIHELSFEEIIKAVIAIIADVLLESIENILITAIDVFVVLVEGILDILDAPIDIPVISDIYKNISGDDLSLLDLGCLIAAIPITVVYKLITDTSPFPNIATTTALIKAPDFDSIKNISNNRMAVVNSSPALLMAADETPSTSSAVSLMATSMLSDSSVDTISTGTNNIIVLTGGIASAVGAVALSVFSPLKQKATTKKLLLPAKIFSVLNGISYLPYVAPDIMGQIPDLQNKKWWAISNEIITDIATVKAMIDMGIGLTAIGSSARTGWDPVSPWLDFGMNILWQIPTTAALFDTENQNLAGILSFAGGTCFDCSGVLAPLLAYDDEPVSWGITVAAATLFNVGYGAMSCASSVEVFKQPS